MKLNIVSLKRSTSEKWKKERNEQVFLNHNMKSQPWLLLIP